MKIRTTIITLLCGSLALGTVGAGCGAVADEPDTAGSAAAKKAPLAVAPRGPARFIAEALADVPLRPEQRAAIDTLANEADARRSDAALARKGLVEAVAAQVEAGRIDRGSLRPKIGAMSDAAARVHPADRAALEKLHGILDADQRAALVSAIEDRFRDRMHDHPGKKRLAEWATDLKLTDDQMAQIRLALKAKMSGDKDRHAWREGFARGKAVLEGFEQDRFVLDEIAPRTDPREKANHMADRVLGMVETVLPILTPEQRTLAAAKIRARAADADDLAP